MDRGWELGRLQEQGKKRDKKRDKITDRILARVIIKATFVSLRPIFFFPRRLISGRSFRANRRGESASIDLSPRRERVFPRSSLAYIFVLTIFPSVHMENPIRVLETRKTCSSRRVGTPRSKRNALHPAWEFPAWRQMHIEKNLFLF